MSAARWDIIIEEGADFDFDLTYLGSDCATIDVTGYGALMEIREKANFPPIFVMSSANSRITVGGTNGRFQINLPAVSTSIPSPPFSRAQYDLKIWPSAASPTINPIRLVEGKAKFEFQISESP